MKQYICDKCGAIIDKNIGAHTFRFPRNCNCYVTDRKGTKFSLITNIEADETHLCLNCMKDIANMFENVEKT